MKKNAKYIKLIISVLSILIALSCNKIREDNFFIKGKTNGIVDGTFIFLQDISTDKILDSTLIENNYFEFDTSLSNFPVGTLVFTKDYPEYRFVWLENNPMTFDASRSNFKNAKVEGSDTENLSQKLYKVASTLPRNERQKMEKDFVKQNPNSILSAYILSVYSATWGKKNVSELFKDFSKRNKESVYGKSISDYLRLNKNPRIGDTFVDFEMQNVYGFSEKLSDFNNKVILLEFWASNCGPCRLENPNLVKTYKKFNPLGFEIFAVSQDTNKENWLKAIEKDSLPWHHVSDLKRKDIASLIYGVTGIPDNFLINTDGEIVGRNLRGNELNDKLSSIFSK